MLDLTPRQRLLSEEFLGNIKEDGYLAATLEEVLASVNELVRGHARTAAPEPEPGEGEDEEEAPPPADEDLPLYTLAEAEAMLDVIQHLDPPGVGARDLRECLLLQLRQEGDTASLTFRLVDQAFADLIAHRWNDLARRIGVQPGDVQAAADRLARLGPKPGLKHSAGNEGYITPDLVVDKMDGQ